jgi:hypothetical protein
MKWEARRDLVPLASLSLFSLALCFCYGFSQENHTGDRSGSFNLGNKLLLDKKWLFHNFRMSFGIEVGETSGKINK